ncbi:MAG TPA: DUF3365 domain-containing protein [Desulfuromonadales bacterium]|nr:DUF3365 domain-containing protein [Desulfuromonadales bacterium]
MNWFYKLKLTAKINLILASLLVCLFLLTGVLTYRDQQNLVLTVALEHARGISRQIIETRKYLVEAVDNVSLEENYDLVPQVVATRIAKRLTEGSPYYVRQVSQRYRNPENQPDAYEAARLEELAGSPEREVHRITSSNGTEYFRYMLEMKAEESCLECHGSYEEAPSFVQERFPPGHFSYDYQIGEVIGAISISIPMAELNRDLGTALRHEILLRVSMLLLVFIAMGLLIRRFVISPIQVASETMGQVAKTGDLSQRIPDRASGDEIGHLISGFNEMMEELGRTNLQRKESEDRYRNLIEAARTAIVTFLEDGKIVISNQRAENLLALHREELLGKSIFDFLERGEALREKISELSQADHVESVKEVCKDRIRGAHDESTEVEATLILASRTDQLRMYTLLLRELS